MEQAWINKAALYEILALAFLYPREDIASALVKGEYAEALEEIARANGLDEAVVLDAVADLVDFKGKHPDAFLHELRAEYTRLFIGVLEPVVSPFAGVWYAEEIGAEPLLFVSKESMAVERFMRSCGVGQAEGTNEPLDHVGTELEFLQYLCLLRAGAVQPPDDVTIPEEAYEEFYAAHFSAWSKKFAQRTIENSRSPFFKAMGRVLAALPQQAL